MITLAYQKSPDHTDMFEVLILDTEAGEVLYKGAVNEIINNG